MLELSIGKFESLNSAYWEAAPAARPRAVGSERSQREGCYSTRSKRAGTFTGESIFIRIGHNTCKVLISNNYIFNYHSLFYTPQECKCICLSVVARASHSLVLRPKGVTGQAPRPLQVIQIHIDLCMLDIG